jgi:hypothetical protein
MAFLTRIDPTRNINRFYVVQVMPSLFGDWTIMPRRSGSKASTGDAVREFSQWTAWWIFLRAGKH